jgi:acetylornithine deacetylase
MMMALLAAKRHIPRPQGRLVFAGCVDEEESGIGTRSAIAGGLQATWSVIGEPTDLQPISAAKGNCYFEVQVTGRSAHAGSPDLGVNAIYGAAQAIAAVRRHDAKLRHRRHPLLGAPSVSVGTIQGGLTASAVPDRCSFGIDRRLMPDETGAAALAELTQDLLAETPDPPGVRIATALHMEMPAMETPLQHPLVRALEAAARDAGAPPLPTAGWSAACDGGYLQRDAGIPSVLFGPGSILHQAHRPDESVPLAEVLTAARTYALLAARALAGALPAA